MGNLSERARGLKDKAIKKGLDNLIWLHKVALPNLKGSRKDPLLYLGTMGAFLFIIVSLATPFGSANKEANMLLLEETYQIGSPFAVPGIKIKESP
ncbi:MAG: hypothetical protein ABH831_00075, partial [Candidatus Nealsonbacteria bacterium]